MSDENVTKRNGLGVDPMQRLASFKPPRDLSLGASKPNKKVFTPNLNVARNKNKGSSSNTREKRDDRGKKERHNDRNKNFRNGPNIIKSSGVFSEGLGSAERHYNRSSYARNEDSAPTALKRPTIRVKDVVKIDKELEEQQINTLMNSGQRPGDDIEEEDWKRNDDHEAPVRLPMDDISCYRVESKPKVQVKKEVIVKTEPPDVDGNIPMVGGLEVTPDDVDTKLESYEHLDVVNLLNSDQPTLMLIKLPDSLPGRGVEEETPWRKRTSQQPNTSAAAPEEPKDDNKTSTESRCRLKDLEEGKIGKLQIHRSGRVTINLGHTSFEVVSVAADVPSRSARLVSLGALTHKLTAVPHWEHMFRHIDTTQTNS